MRKFLLLLLCFPSIALASSFLEYQQTVTIKVGPLVDPTDASPETALTVSQADVRISKNGGDFGQKNDANACSVHDELGFYNCQLNATDTGTLGILTVAVNDGGNSLVWARNYQIVSAAFYDLLDGTDDLGVVDANVDTILARQVLFADDIDTVTSQTQLIENENKPLIDNNYIGYEMCITDVGASPQDTYCAVITDYATGTGTFTIASSQIPFTIAVNDTYYIRPTGANARAINSVKLKGIGTSGNPWAPDD